MIARRLRWAGLLSAALLSSIVTPAAVAEPPRFEARVLDPHAGNIVYAVTHADVDGDGLQDVVALTEDKVLWYRAPDWEKGTILDGGTVRDNVCIAPHDIDGDGRIDFALGAGWPKSGGTIQWLGRDPGTETWNVHFISEIPWTHRMRWADVLGTGKAQLTVSPLNKAERSTGVALTAFAVPENPRTDRWPATVMDQTLDRMHNHWHSSHEADQDDELVFTLTASQEGVHAVFPAPQVPRAAGVFVKVKLVDGAAGDTPANRGAGEVKSGRFQNGRRLFATVEPMHGTHAVVYLMNESTEPMTLPTFKRHVLDDTLQRGHALWLADLDGDGTDEVVVGHSEPGTGPVKGPGVYV